MDKVLVGLSGGADSVALLLELLAQGREVCAVHVNHGLRGEESDGDEAFVRQLCREKNVSLMVFRANPPENPGEEWARQVRYGFFREAMNSSGANCLALAHHRDDQAETLLLHLLRGCGLTGLTGMAEDEEIQGLHILRPLLGRSREELRETLRAAGQPWREDASNQDARYLRNALRLEVLPKLDSLIPGTSRRLASTASILREDEEALEALAEEYLGDRSVPWLPLKPLLSKPSGLRKRILRLWWTRVMPPQEERALSNAQTEALHSLLEASAGSKCNLPGLWHGQRGWTHLHLVRQEKTSCDVRMSRQTFEGDYGDGKRRQVVPAALLPQLTLRTRQKGDWIQPFGSAGKQSLQDYLVNRRVDAPFRDMVPLVCRGSEVLLAGGVGAGEGLRVRKRESLVMLCLEGDMPWQDDQ